METTAPEVSVPRMVIAALADAGFDPVVIKFAADTAFGRQIEFKPIGFFLAKPHPIIKELRAAVDGAKRA